MTSQEGHRTIPERISSILESWATKSVRLRWLHTVLIIAAVMSSILASAGVGQDFFRDRGFLKNVQNPLSVIAAIAIGLVSAFELGTKANNFRNAHRVLRAAILRYEEEPEYQIEKLIEAYEVGERLIGNVKENPNA